MTFAKAIESAKWHLTANSPHAKPDSIVWYKVKNGQWMFASKEYAKAFVSQKTFTNKEMTEFKV